MNAATVLKELKAREPVNAAGMREVGKPLNRAMRHADPGAVVALAQELVDSGGWAPRQVAYELLASHKAALASLGAAALKRLGRGMDDWATVDGFSVYVAGPVWRAGQIRDKEIAHWAGSKDRWWRRAALVATVPLNQKSRGGRGDPPRTLAVCDLLLDDRDDMVVKALSWALRELAKREPDPVRAYLERHGHEIAARVRREVGNKLRTGHKNP